VVVRRMGRIDRHDRGQFITRAGGSLTRGGREREALAGKEATRP
jgi:hypothetical protein